ncbi:methyltransferase domain-containing protein [Roseovarius sp. SCSIO 43702]|uniref:methyltransferase domain-containing protein n=1 Tax=Roseovarius sp. SCSIO 43702 TaxID=2823043 RepID=UPI001C739F26|nr:methyltransferase domain-containing protein [Roseovarius sp. SCSIO 43702]QYX57022.1 methyltransferase domain-containing protein [Roseovarius sp. SCSIO 43702]
MTTPPKLTDRAALARHRARRAPGSALFLHEAAIDEMHDRLSMVNKTFHRPAVVTGHPSAWGGVLPGAKLVPDDETLDLGENAHDLILHGMCLHWANDPVGQLIQCRRALEPDGLLLVAMLGGETLQELRASLAQAEAEVSGGLSPRVAPMAEIRDLGGLMQRAGFALPVADLLPLRASYRDLAHLAHDLRAMGETSALEARPRRFTRRSLFDRADALYRAHFAEDDGRIRASFDLIMLTGWSPDASQPQPLRPGSASARLADALGTTEKPLKD